VNENVELWIDALRSGNYDQGRNHLHTVDEDGNDLFCCLGVACDLYQKEIGGLQVETISVADDVVAYDEARFTLPEKVKKWLGLSYENGQYFTETGINHLADHNDSGLSFKEIANIIAAEPDGMFE
jgi:hypothetical protein